LLPLLPVWPGLEKFRHLGAMFGRLAQFFYCKFFSMKNRPKFY
jgi:hypothetical protein